MPDGRLESRVTDAKLQSNYQTERCAFVTNFFRVGKQFHSRHECDTPGCIRLMYINVSWYILIHYVLISEGSINIDWRVLTFGRVYIHTLGTFLLKEDHDSGGPDKLLETTTFSFSIHCIMSVIHQGVYTRVHTPGCIHQGVYIETFISARNNNYRIEFSKRKWCISIRASSGNWNGNF